MTAQLYNLLLRAATPIARLYLNTKPPLKPLAQRFNPPVPQLPAPPIWVHACSVGEINTARPLLQALHAHHPKIPLLLTTSTITGMAHAQNNPTPNTTITWCPFDTPTAVRRFLQQANPRTLILIETEIWPNLIHHTHHANIPILLINGRLSDKHHHRYQRARRLFKPAFAALTLAAMQEQRYAERIITLGTHPDHVCTTGNTKFDAVRTQIDPATRARLRAQHAIPEDAPILLFGSTRPGDENLASACWASLKDEFPTLHLIIAPRHLERTPEALAPFTEPVLQRSSLKTGQRPNAHRVHLIDTHGELTHFYAIATLAVIGGSLYPGVEGHNPLEPAALGTPTIFGPHMANFAEPAAILLAANAARRVPCPEDLYATLHALLSDPAECRHLGTRARKTILANQGALNRTTTLINQILQLHTPASHTPTPPQT